MREHPLCELRALGATPGLARQVAANSRRWWRNSGLLLNSVLTWLGSTGLACPDSHDLNFSNHPARTRMPGGVGEVRSAMIGPYPDGPQFGARQRRAPT